MKYTPVCLVVAAGIATLAVGQALTPIVRAQPSQTPDYCLRLDWQTGERTAGGLVIHGHVTNVGHRLLTYTQVTPILKDSLGHTIFRGSGYLTTSPLRPGASADFRSCEPAAPPFSSFSVEFHEAGHSVTLKTLSPPGRLARTF